MMAIRSEPMADHVMLVAPAEGPQGSVFFKLTGAEDIAQKAEQGFEALVTSLSVI